MSRPSLVRLATLSEDTVLLSVHMVQHMTLGMVTPIFLALGAPVTLALRVLLPRPGDLLDAFQPFDVRLQALPPGTRAAALGGYVRLGLYPNVGVAWYWACLVGEGRPLTTCPSRPTPTSRSRSSTPSSPS